MEQIDLFVPPTSQYSELHHFLVKLFEAIKRTPIKCRLLEAKTRDPAPFLETLFEEPPDCTLSFNGLLPDDAGNFFCDMIEIPHVTYLVDSPNLYVSLVQSALTIIACVDQASVDFFNGLGFNKAFFLPHAVERELNFDPHAKREYDVVMLGSCIDYQSISNSWKKKYSAPLRNALEEAAEQTLSNIHVSYHQAFVEAIDRQISKQSGIDPRELDFLELLQELEYYLRGKDRIELLNNIQDAKVDVFGSSEGIETWGGFLSKKRNITVHDPVHFEQAIDIMKHSKIVLNSSPWIHYGAHERIFTGMASGALVITNENLYLKEQFTDGESIIFYRPGFYDKANHRINEYLADEQKRADIAHRGRELTMKFHTWDARAAELLKKLPNLL